MKEREFLDALFPDGTAYLQACATTLVNGKLRTRHGVLTQDRQKLIDHLANWTTQSYSTYFCVGCYSAVDASKPTARTCHTLAPERQFVVLDFDVKDQQPPYTNTGKILAAVSADLGTPSMVFDSGGGVHLYYLTKSPAIGQQMRARAHYRDKTTGPYIDQRTCIAEVDLIRWPFGYNFKRGVPCKHLGGSGRIVDSLTGLPLITETHSKRGKGGGSILPSGTAPLRTPYAARVVVPERRPLTSSIVNGCAAMKHFWKEQHPHGSRDLTRDDMLTFMTVMQFSETKSGATPESQRETCVQILHKWDGSSIDQLKYQYDSLKHPRGCDTVSPALHKLCTSCEYHAQHSRETKPTPVGAGIFYEDKPPPPAAPPPQKKPEVLPQSVLQPGPVSTVIVHPAEDHLTTIPNQFHIDNSGIYLRDGNNGNIKVCSKGFRVRRGRVRTESGVIFAIDLHGSVDYVKLRGQRGGQLEALAHVGITPSRSTPKIQSALHDYVHRCCEQCVWVPSRFGWSGKNQFAFPETTLTYNKGITHDPAPIVGEEGWDNLEMMPAADAGLWWGACHELFFDHPEMWARGEMVLASFAAALYQVYGSQGVKGHTLNISGPGNSGKSAALAAAHQVWGSGDKVATSSDSVVYLYNAFKLHKNMPVTSDDVTREGVFKGDLGTTLSDIIHVVSEGKERGRGRQDGGSKLAGTFSTMLLTTSNKPIKDIINVGQTDTVAAALDRITEHRVVDVSGTLGYKNVDIIEKSTRCGRVMSQNAGSAGREFIMHVMANKAKYQHHADMYQTSLSSLRNRHTVVFRTLMDVAHEVLKDMGRLKLTDEYRNTIGIGLENAKSRVRKTAIETKTLSRAHIPTPQEVIAYFSRNVVEIDMVGKNFVMVTNLHNNIQISPDNIFVLKEPERLWGDVYKNIQIKGRVAHIIRKSSITTYLKNNYRNGPSPYVGDVLDSWESQDVVPANGIRLPNINVNAGSLPPVPCLVIYM